MLDYRTLEAPPPGIRQIEGKPERPKLESLLEPEQTALELGNAQDRILLLEQKLFDGMAQRQVGAAKVVENRVEVASQEQRQRKTIVQLIAPVG